MNAEGRGAAAHIYTSPAAREVETKPLLARREGSDTPKPTRFRLGPMALAPLVC